MGKPSRGQSNRAARKGLKAHRPDIIVLDLKDHILGRAASIVAKQLLLGKKITVVRADKINIAGSEIRNKIKFLNFLKKRKITNPKKGPFHKRAPSDIFIRTVRAMLPKQSSKRRLGALRRLAVYEGVPANVANKGARAVIPKALRRNCLRPERPVTVLGEMCQHIGWKYKAVIDRVESARIARGKRFHERTAKVRDAWKTAKKAGLAKINAHNKDVLKKFGVIA